ncbi:putative beta-glucosidase G [Fusarium oxysporum f. sp. narcissi]|uniref:Beta-glucosidase cel3A n=1 Tax=Fusarium oxysporum f. sp. narcissi TaxID=451672 RepID=A0A4Q2V4I8_FUSOX|nr:putative beta-glucosidase G [Fusarium oxysporum f. sp. narcissi]
MVRLKLSPVVVVGAALATAQSQKTFQKEDVDVYPSREFTSERKWCMSLAYKTLALMTGANEAADVLAATNRFISSLTLDEKAGIVDGSDGPCGGNIAPIPRVNFKGICLQDSPLGVREADFVTMFPAGLTAGASFDKRLMYERGLLMADEFRAKGINIALSYVPGLSPSSGGLLTGVFSPAVEPLGRSALGGRNWEGFGSDPYLAGIGAMETVAGFNEREVQSTIKHWIGNEQETMRNPALTTNGTVLQESISSNIDDRTMHEVYMWPFVDAIHAGVSHVMCSYQRLNQTYACENSKSLNGLLKGELGFQGAVMSDWFATHSGVPAIKAGLDLNMPGGIYSPYFMDVANYVRNGTISEKRLDDMVRRILTPYFRFQQHKITFPPLDPSINEFKKQSLAATGIAVFKPAGPDEIPQWNMGLPKSHDVRKNHGAFVRELGAAGAVLLKNKGALPFKELSNIAVIGNDAADLSQGLFALNNTDPIGPEYGANAQGGGSGTGRFSYFVSPLEAIKARMGKGLTQYILDNNIAAQTIGSIYPPPEACLVFVKSFATEAHDRPSLNLDSDGAAVIRTVSQSCNNTIVITHTGGANVMPWADNPNVAAIIAGHLPGQEIGNSIADILWGDVNPSGKLPYTIAYRESDYNAPIVNVTNSTGLRAWQSDFIEGLLIDYRHFDASGIAPRYEFGFGLSYTTFDMKLSSMSKLQEDIAPVAPAVKIIPGGYSALFDPLVEVRITVDNTGKLSGRAVPQLYLSHPSTAPKGTPIKVLRGFERTKHLAPGDSQVISFILLRKDMSFWDVDAQNWRIPNGEFTIRLGFSSRDLREHGSITLIA